MKNCALLVLMFLAGRSEGKGKFKLFFVANRLGNKIDGKFNFLHYFSIHVALTTGSWVLGDTGETCQDACTKMGSNCNAEKQSSLTTNELLDAAMLEAGYKCKGFANKPSSHDGAPFSTNRQGDDCTPITNGTVSSCTNNKSRRRRSLCYCEKGKVSNNNHFHQM